ncbi:hypothetical protein [uncultured Dokdonia sp.]|mgnify:FL=1|uniref:hypothetical protein n=1 Tax=uncultured Dokdonia sp. TaxID=575653 RepID=UPI00260CF8F1|nr:hypothetical protein [uncultured Dokdonia sp.]
MKKLKTISGASILNSKQQKDIVGGISGDPDLSKCGCDCAGRVTGPYYCRFYIGCPQVYTCGDAS